ncbi:MAG: L-2-amino-thiazoline-4-carboxylic acid hydrolase [Deltaproteobacteria bacterium]|nr:L-2-amino-thiazoline-4-carboxylic acid hydrolase [Deltaproteobacteria bacterium]
MRASIASRWLIAGTRKEIRQLMEAEVGAGTARETLARTQRRFSEICRELPRVGSLLNPLSIILIWASWCLALYLVLAESGRSAEWVGERILQAFERQLRSYPRLLTSLLNRVWFSRLNARVVRRWCNASQARPVPGGWSARFVERDGTRFDLGMDYTSCGICTLFTRYQAAALAPYMCQTDPIMSGVLGHQLSRTKTLAEGGVCCDFRYSATLRD